MGIRKWTSVDTSAAPAEVAAMVKGVVVTEQASAYVRTVCTQCGEFSANKKTKCSCGNTEFIVCNSYYTPFYTEKPTVTVKGDDVHIEVTTWQIQLQKDITVASSKSTILSRESGRLTFDSYRHGNDVIEILKEHKDELPLDFQEALEVYEEFGLSGNNYLKNLLTYKPNTMLFIQYEKDRHREFVKAVINDVYNSWRGYNDIDFRTMDEFYKEYRVPEEFKEFVDTHPSNMLNRTFDKRWGNYSRTSNGAVFQLPNEWHKVPDEIKAVAKYYLENNVIGVETYFSLGNIDNMLLRNYRHITNLFFKKYMMMYTNRIVTELNAVYNYLIENGLPVDDKTLDAKFCNQHRNLSDMKERLARYEYDIDTFFNACDVDAVKAIERLATSKRMKRAKTE